MIRATLKYFSGVPAVVIDGGIYVAVAMCLAAQTGFGDDEAAKFISPAVLFWIKKTLAIVGGGIFALKLYRSTAYGDHQREKKLQEETNQWRQVDPQKAP
jgi:hypothetical protein